MKNCLLWTLSLQRSTKTASLLSIPSLLKPRYVGSDISNILHRYRRLDAHGKISGLFPTCLLAFLILCSSEYRYTDQCRLRLVTFRVPVTRRTTRIDSAGHGSRFTPRWVCPYSLSRLSKCFWVFLIDTLSGSVPCHLLLPLITNLVASFSTGQIQTEVITTRGLTGQFVSSYPRRIPFTNPIPPKPGFSLWRILRALVRRLRFLGPRGAAGSKVCLILTFQKPFVVNNVGKVL